MLVLTRRVGEEIVIGDNIHLSVVSVQGNKVRLGIGAPLSVRIVREEVHGTAAAAMAAADSAATGRYAMQSDLVTQFGH